MEGETLTTGDESTINYASYVDETQLDRVMALIDKELSEPYSIFTYRYFITLWPHLCFMAFDGNECVGTIVCKMGQHRSTFRGYIAMLVVIKPYRGKGIATELVTKCLQVMRESGCDEVALEAEVTNKGALALYGNLGFVRAKRLHRYYLNGVDAYRLKLLFPRPQDAQLLLELQAHEQHKDCGDDHHHDHHNHHHEHHHHGHDDSCGHDHHHDHHHHSHGDSCGHDHHHSSGSQGASSARPVYLQELSRKSASPHALRWQVFISALHKLPVFTRVGKSFEEGKDRDLISLQNQVCSQKVHRCSHNILYYSSPVALSKFPKMECF